MRNQLLISVILILLISTICGHDTSCLQSHSVRQLCVIDDDSQIAASRTFTVTSLQTECRTNFLEKHLGRLCDDNHHHHHDRKEAAESEKLVYGIISVMVVSAVTLVGLLIRPIIYQISFEYVLNLLTALAVGTLFGDAMFHLTPYIMGLHTDSDDHHAHDHSPSFVSFYEWKIFKILTSVCVLYVFYLLEVFLHWFAHYKNNYDSICSDTAEQNHRCIRANTDADLAEQNERQHLNTPSVYSNAKDFFNNNSIPCTPYVELNEFHLVPDSFVEDSNAQVYKSQLSDVSDRVETTTEQLETVQSNGWMVLLDNTIHNFANGLAIGAAFKHNILFGSTTVVAVICYRLRQELGDFTVLLQAGFSRSRAILWCFLSVVTLWIGFFVGITVSTDENTRQWIFVATCGMFFYVALVDLLPTLLADGELELKRFLIVNGGFLFGIGLMFLLAVFEEKTRS